MKSFLLLIMSLLMITKIATAGEQQPSKNNSNLFNEMRNSLFRQQTSIVDHDDSIVVFAVAGDLLSDIYDAQ
uniref:Putative secreted protein n=1 Tax=Panstrongylus lignarius TaxID=156445 RepID=A0A224Y4S5_9HEMI